MVQETQQHAGLGFRLTQAYFAYRSLLDKKLKASSFGGVVPSGCVALWFYVLGHDGCTPTEVVRQLGLSKSTVSSQIDQLEGKGLLERRPSDTDGRSVLLYLTDKSRGYKAEVDQFVKELDAELLAVQGDDAVEVVNGLQKIHQLSHAS